MIFSLLILNNFLQLSKLFIWFLLLIGYLITIYDIYYWTYGEPYNRWISALLFPSTRIIWATNNATLIWMCITGNGGLINKFLSWKPFIPLSRLTYSVYLTHAWVMWTYWGSRRDLVDMHDFNFITVFSGILLISYTIGAIFSLLFESPFIVLQNHLKDYLTINKTHKKDFQNILRDANQMQSQTDKHHKCEDKQQNIKQQNIKQENISQL